MTIQPIQDQVDAIEPAVIDAEIVDDGRPDVVQLPATRTVHPVVQAVVTVAKHDRSKIAARHVFTILQGFESWTMRTWDASTMGTFRRMIRAAERAGDIEALKTWVELKEQAQERRWRRLMDLPTMLLGLVKVTAIGMVAIPGAVLLISILAALTGNGTFSGVWNGFVQVLGILVLVGMVLAGFLWYGGLPAIVLYLAFREGQRRAEPPRWLMTERDLASTLLIDESTISRALGSLRLKPISDHLKEGLAIEFVTPARVDGRGTHAVVRLPVGATADEVMKRRAKVAGALHRSEGETWLQVGAEAGLLDLWIADKGALAEGAGSYPLLMEGTADFFKGVPVAKTLRGDVLTAPLSGNNTITGGLPGQGKSSSARILMLGAALDPTVELRIYVPDENFDFARFEPRCGRYVMGSDRDQIERIRDQVVDLRQELQRRGRLLSEFEAESVDRKLADKDVGLHPIVALFEECHVLFQDPEYGKEFAYEMEQIVKLDRKRGVHIILSTQAPTATSIPREIGRNMSLGIAFAVTDHVANDGLLGSGAYKAGHRATILRPGADRGTSVVKGFSGERSEVAQWFFVSGSKGADEVSPIIARSIAAMNGKPVPGTGRQVEAAPSRDLLDDVAAVLVDLADEDTMRITDVVAGLRKVAPDWAAYKPLNGTKLRQRLAAEYEIEVPSTDRKYPVKAGAVRAAQAARGE